MFRLASVKSGGGGQFLGLFWAYVLILSISGCRGFYRPSVRCHPWHRRWFPHRTSSGGMRLPRLRGGLGVLANMGLPHTWQAAGLAGRRGGAHSQLLLLGQRVCRDGAVALSPPFGQGWRPVIAGLVLAIRRGKSRRFGPVVVWFWSCYWA